jgi:hypothetical protein
MSDLLRGSEIRANPWLPKAGTVEWRWFPDWRERLHRNLTRRLGARPRTPEPLAVEYRPPNMFLIGRTLYGHPDVVGLVLAELPSGPSPDQTSEAAE